MKKMSTAPESSVVVIISCFLLVTFLSSSGATAFNITMLLNKYTQFSTFNDLLNQTGIAREINGRQTITVLAVDNGAMAGVSGRPLDVVKSILSVHIILDFYDHPKLLHLSKKSSIVTTLYQTTGIANTQQGFLNITTFPNRNVGFASAIKGSPLDVHLVRQLDDIRYNISILQVSGIILTPGIDGNAYIPPPAGAPKKSPVAHAPTPPKKSPAPSPDEEEPMSPESSPPAESPADVPVSSPPVSADGPVADGDNKSAASPSSEKKTSAAATGFSSCFMVLALASSLAAAL